MANREPKSLFRRLTKLFRSGPIVKRKVRGLDTGMAVADKTKSSGTLLFQKSLSPTYATITSNAYNLSERLMRYQDFQEMEYSLAIDTKIATPDGFKTIGELSDECSKDPEKTFIVYSYDHVNKCIVPAIAKQARQTCVDHAWKITFENGQTITASPEHRLMLRDGTYKKVEDLQSGDSMMPFYRRDLFAAAAEGTKGYSWIYTMNDKFRGWTKEHQLIAEWVSGRELTEDECVHHINFNKSDNRPENLRIMTNSDHNSYHAAINNGVKWAPENHEWIETFKKNHAVWMRDNAPTARRDITFARILETAERVGFSMPSISSVLDVSWNLILERLVQNGFANFSQFVAAYSQGQHHTMIASKPGLLTRDLSIELLKSNIVENDTKRSLSIKLGCTVNVLDKFFARHARTTWAEFRQTFGFKNESVAVYNSKNVRAGGRPKGSNKGDLTFQQICDAYTPGLTLPRLTEKLGVNTNTIISRLAQNGHKKYSEFGASYGNHKVVSIEYVGIIPLYDLTVDGYKNFATDTVISHNTPELASALDIYADEICAQDDKGRVLHVFSDNERVKEILEDLFYNTLNIEFNLRSWTRNLVKYGDMFLYNDVSPDHGVVNAFPIPVNEIEREENYDREDPFAVRFRWVTLGNRTLENWEVTHFRLLGNDMFLPYGSSVIEPARRIWRQLILIEDAMLVYRVVRAPERRVFYIDVANIPPENVSMYVEEQKRNLRTNQVIDRDTGRVDLRYNPLPVHKDTPVPLLDGTTLTIEKLAEKMKVEPNWTPWVYSVQDNTKNLVPGKVVWCDKNYTAKKLTKIWLDDGSYVTTAPEHPFVMRDGSSRRADELQSGDSLMSAYRDLTNTGYERIIEPNGQRNFTHAIVARDVYTQKWESTDKRVVHHKHPELGVSNKRNNTPENLEVMNFREHRKMHADHCELTLNTPERLAQRREARIAFNKSPEKRKRVSELNKVLGKAQKMGLAYNGTELHSQHNAIRSEAQLKSWETDKEVRSSAMQWIIPNDVVSFVFDQVKKNKKIGREELTLALRNDELMMNSLIVANKENKRNVSKFHVNAVVCKIHRMGCINTPKFNDFRKFAVTSEAPVNHQVIKVEMIDDANDDVYCMTVVGSAGEDDRHNFAVNGMGSEMGPNQLKSLIFVWNSVDEDYFIPVRGGDSGTKIDTLQGGQNTAAVEDVAYIQKKLFAALKIPRAYLGYDEMLSSKATLAQEDIRFSRTISVIQKTILAELNKLAIIHLYANGYDADDLQDFTLRMSNPSTIAQQQKLELWRAKFEIGASLPEGMGSKEFVQTEIWGISQDQIENINKQRIREKKLDMSIEATQSEEGSEGASDGGGGEDLFGDEGGGGEEAEPADAAADKGAPPEENAGEEPEEDQDPDVELLTSGDNADDEESYAVRLPKSDGKSHVKVSKQLKHTQYNRGRRRTHGASKTHMPDFMSMTDNSSKAMTDPTDSTWMKSVVSNPFSESTNSNRINVGLSNDVTTMLTRMGKALNVTKQVNGTVLVEGLDVQDEIDSKSDYDFVNESVFIDDEES